MMNINDKKGQGLPLNVIVIAAIVILVLLVLSVIFLRGSADFSSDVASCEVQGGTCYGPFEATSCGDLTAPNTFARPDLDCPKTSDGRDQICCTPESNAN